MVDAVVHTTLRFETASVGAELAEPEELEEPEVANYNVGEVVPQQLDNGNCIYYSTETQQVS